MQEAPKKMNIHITLGEENGLQFLADSNILVTSNPALVQNLILQSQFKEDIGNDVILVFHFYVEQGKQKEGVAYFQEALNQTIEQNQMSPIQKHLRRPNNKGTVNIVETPGCIILEYRFYEAEIASEEGMAAFESQFDKYEKATLEFSSILKGHIKHNNKNRTNLKVDYVDVRASSDQISPSDFMKLLESIHGGENQQLEFLLKIPALQMIGNLKSADFEMKLASFRQIRSFYYKVCKPDVQSQDKPFPYVNRGIFRKQINVFSLFKNKIGAKFQGSYNGEDVLMRLLKVYEVFWTKGFNL